MNLVEKFKQEIQELNLKEPYEIAYFLYIRTGEIFEYNPLWEIASDKEATKIFKERIDIYCVQQFKIVCSSWAYLYKDLLEAFKIHAQIVGKNHVKVIFWINQIEYVADMTKNYEDLWRIKFGLPLLHFHPKDKEVIEDKKLDKKIKYDKGIQIVEVLKIIRQELEYVKIGEYPYQLCKIMETIMQFQRKNVEYVSGREWLEFAFTELDYPLEYARFFDKRKHIYFNVYQIFDEKNFPHYFAYQRMPNDYFEFHEIEKNTLYENLSQYETIDEENIGIIKL